MQFRLPEQREQIKNRFKEMKTVQDNLKVALVFLKACYLQYANAKNQPRFTDLENFYQEELEELAELKCGEQYARLLKNFISNFPVGNFLRMQNNLGQMEMHYRVLACHILIHVLSNVKEVNPICNLFYNYDGDGRPKFDVTQFNNQFMPGIELNAKYQYLYDLHVNYEERKNKNTYHPDLRGGANYSCGVDCDYFYIVQDCGNVAMAGTCPWCNRSIGAYKGAYNTIEQRPGHLRYKEKEAKEYLKKLVDKYEQNQKAGYSVIAPNAEWQM